MKRSNRLRRTREWRPEISVDPAILAYVGTQHSLWHENEGDAAREATREMEQAQLLRWVRREMGRRLTPRERRMVELYYFEAMTLEQVARRQKIHFSTVSRSLRRAVGKLRAAARENAGAESPRRAVLREMRGEE